MNATAKKVGHTPGPWQLVEKNLVWWVCPLAGEPVDIISKHGSVTTKDRSPDEVEANARLIAAAPDLLDACKAVLGWATRECMPQGGKNDGPWEQIEAAIAKAESA